MWKQKKKEDTVLVSRDCTQGCSKMAAEQLEAPSTCSQPWTSLAAKPPSNQLENPTECEWEHVWVSVCVDKCSGVCVSVRVPICLQSHSRLSLQSHCCCLSCCLAQCFWPCIFVEGAILWDLQYPPLEETVKVAVPWHLDLTLWYPSPLGHARPCTLPPPGPRAQVTAVLATEGAVASPPQGPLEPWTRQNHSEEAADWSGSQEC